MANYVSLLPEMLTGHDLLSALTVLPDYDDGIRYENTAARLVALSDLYQIYIPSPMTTEIYSKLYLSLMRSLQKKGTKLAVQQRYENHKATQSQRYNGLMGGSDSFSIIGCSGLGKSSAINQAVSLITQDGVIETKQPYCKIIPCMVVQCPFDSSIKGLLLEILRKADEELGTDNYSHAVKSRVYTTDVLIGTVSTVLLNNVGLLIVDEIQHVVNNKHGNALMSALLQLINNSGISICLVGTPECVSFFEQAMQLARRSLGLQYQRLEYDQYFHDFCCTLFQYQYVRQKATISPAIIEWLYEHSAGVISLVVSLIHDAQEIAILNGSELLDMAALNEAYEKRLSLLHGYIETSIRRNLQCKSQKKKTAVPPLAVPLQATETEFTIAELATEAKNSGVDMVSLLKQHMTVIEVTV